MQLVIRIDCDNDAFADSLPGEVGWILANLTNKLREGNLSGTLRDVNGNTVGEYVLS